MNNTDNEPAPLEGASPAAPQPVLEALPAHETTVGGDMRVRRALPTKLRRRVGAWCFLDHYGPVAVTAGEAGMRVGPHPHIGLQTVSWLYAGEVLHRDSLGSLQLIRPGQLNLMTAGRGIAHAEETPPTHSVALHGLQFWIALPEGARHTDPAFDHHPALPRIRHDGLSVTLIIGAALGERSPARTYSPLLGCDILCPDTGRRQLPLVPDFEHALLVTQGSLTVEGREMAPGTLYYLGAGRERITLANAAPAQAFLLGGAPMGENVLLWWNFVARSTEEMAAARADWEAGAPRFGAVKGYAGERLMAPPLNGRLKPS
jgi:redox-sensitive bicupin YhaK (pirin superfamily)